MYLFIYWFISVLLLLFLSGYIVSCYYSASSFIFHAWLHEVIPNTNLYWQPTEEVTDETSIEVVYTM